ncbi:MAG: alpha/beta hydrolase [Litorimonas sp.]
MHLFWKFGVILTSLFVLLACQTIEQTSYNTELTRQTYPSFDGQDLSYIERGEGPVLLLLHGFSSSAEQNFVETGIVDAFSDAGYRVIAPDMRGHGQSQVRDAPEGWPRDAAARDQIALMTHLETSPHSVIGYSYGALTAIRYHLLTRDEAYLILGGIGDVAADEMNTERNDAFRRALDQLAAGEDTPGAKLFAARIAATDGTVAGLRGALSSRLYTEADVLATFDVPALVMTGDQDLANGSGKALAKIIPGAEYRQLKGTHLSAVIDPNFVRNSLDFIRLDHP